MPITHQINPRELLGRRLFGKEGWNSSRPIFDFTHFVDTRLHLDLSVDRLGAGNVENNRLRYLTQLGDVEGGTRQRPTTFEGWAAVLLQDLKFPGWNTDVRPVPVTGGNGVPANEFHSEISREGFRQKAQSYTFATMMADRFSRKGRYVSPIRKKATSG
jgi:hypothetical protein